MPVQVAVGGSAAKAANVPDPRIRHVLRPTLGCPSFAVPGGHLEVDFSLRDLGRHQVVGWRAYITTSNDPVKLSVDLEFVEAEPRDGSVFSLTFKVPERVPEDLYDLEVRAELQGGDVLRDGQPHAVKVVKQLDDDLTIVHLTDPQIGDLLSAINNPTESLPNWLASVPFNQYWKYLHKAIDAINLMKPDLVIITGDLVYGQLYFGEYPPEYDLIYRYLLKFEVPVFVAPGNHDSYKQAEWDGKEFFKNYLAPMRYSFNHGPIHFVALDTYDWPDMDRSGYGLLVSTWGGQVRRDQLSWLEEDLRSHAGDAMRVVYCHHSPDDPSDWPPVAWKICLAAAYPFPQLYLRLLFGLLYDQEWMGDGRSELLRILDSRKVDLLLAGHVHHDRLTMDINSYGTDVVITTGASFNVQAGKAYPGFRVIEVRDGRVASFGYLGQWSHPIYSNGFPPAPNLAQQVEPALSWSFAHPNDGSSTSNQLVVVNRYLEPVPVYAEFTLPAGKEYQVENGEVWQVSRRGDKLVLYVRSRAGAASDLKVSVYPRRGPVKGRRASSGRSCRI
jgi:3',5'-cyclic AMP phosphodiesterase CpdA